MTWILHVSASRLSTANFQTLVDLPDFNNNPEFFDASREGDLVSQSRLSMYGNEMLPLLQSLVCTFPSLPISLHLNKKSPYYHLNPSQSSKRHASPLLSVIGTRWSHATLYLKFQARYTETSAGLHSLWISYPLISNAIPRSLSQDWLLGDWTGDTRRSWWLALHKHILWILQAIQGQEVLTCPALSCNFGEGHPFPSRTSI